MDINSFINLIIRKIRLLIIIPVISGILMFLLSSNQTKEYSARATIFTGITSSSSLEDLGNSRVDFFATKTAYNNLLSIINSGNVRQETSLRLLSRHLILSKAIENEISNESFEKLIRIVPEDIKKLVVKPDIEATYKNLTAYMKQDKSNFIYGLLNLNHPHYSIKAISNVKTQQVGSSDIIELTYKSDDPAIAYQTLNVLIDVFLKTYANLKKNQTNAVVEYFEQQLKKSSNELDNAEDRLLDFNKSNNIINYYEQTKHISSQQEKIEIKLQDILLEYEAAGAVLEKLEDETQIRFNINLRNKEILDLRKSLIIVNKSIAESEMEPDYSKAGQPLQYEAHKMKSKLERELRNKLDSINIYQRNSEGIAISKLLNDWLKTVIEYESAKARLLAMKTKSEEFQQLYNQYAPLGAILKRIEREIKVKEKAYLEILHHLGLAKLKQQNEEMMANMKVLDSPQLPIDPEPTKRKVMLIAITFFSFILTLLGLFVFELLDNTIKTRNRFTEKTGLKLIGALPMYSSNNRKLSTNLITKGNRPIVEYLLNKKNEQKNEGPLVVQFLSILRGEGKSYLTGKIAESIQNNGYTCSHLNLIDKKTEQKKNTGTVIGINQFNYSNYASILENSEAYSDKDFVLVEVPSLSETINNTALIKTANISLLVADACRVWDNSDDFILENLKVNLDGNFGGILNKVFPHHLEDIIGIIPKKRSRLRIYVKSRILKRLP